MSKLRAGLTHFGLSALVVGSVCAVVFAFWYPPPYFAIKGTWGALKVLLGVDLVLGPVMTLILWKPGKWGLKFDMTVVVVVQLAALTYGTSVLYRERPYFLVFAVDRFEVVSLPEIDRDSLDPGFAEAKPWSGPEWVFAEPPKDLKAQQALLEEVVFEGKPDIERRPELWRDYDEHRDAVLARAHSYSDLVDANDATAQKLERIADDHDKRLEDLGYLPIVGRDGLFALIVDMADAAPLEAVTIDAWPDDTEIASN